MSKRILIVEDEPLISDDLEIVINGLGYKVVGIADTTKKAMAILESNEVDLVLLDIQLKGEESGIDLADQINEKFQIPFIYLTSFYDDDTLFHIRSTNPAGYIVKPYKDIDLKVNISLAFNKNEWGKEKRDTAVSPEKLSLFVRKNGEIKQINHQDIHWVKGEDNYSDIYYEKDERSTVAQTLKAIENKFAPYGFVRIHKSYLVNLAKVSTINGTTLYIKQQALPIGKTYRKLLFERLTVI